MKGRRGKSQGIKMQVLSYRTDDEDEEVRGHKNLLGAKSDWEAIGYYVSKK